MILAKTFLSLLSFIGTCIRKVFEWRLYLMWAFSGVFGGIFFN